MRAWCCGVKQGVSEIADVLFTLRLLILCASGTCEGISIVPPCVVNWCQVCRVGENTLFSFIESHLMYSKFSSNCLHEKGWNGDHAKQKWTTPVFITFIHFWAKNRALFLLPGLVSGENFEYNYSVRINDLKCTSPWSFKRPQRARYSYRHGFSLLYGSLVVSAVTMTLISPEMSSAREKADTWKSRPRSVVATERRKSHSEKTGDGRLVEYSNCEPGFSSGIHKQLSFCPVYITSWLAVQGVGLLCSIHSKSSRQKSFVL